MGFYRFIFVFNRQWANDNSNKSCFTHFFSRIQALCFRLWENDFKLKCIKILKHCIFEGGCTCKKGGQEQCLHNYRLLCHKYHKLMMYSFPYFVSILFPLLCICRMYLFFKRNEKILYVYYVFWLLQNWCKQACLHSWWCNNLDITNWIKIEYLYLVIEPHMRTTYVLRLINIVTLIFR